VVDLGRVAGVEGVDDEIEIAALGPRLTMGLNDLGLNGNAALAIVRR
jgi:hypothetical protein